MPELSPEMVRDLVLSVLDEYKAEDIACMPAKGIAHYTDYLVLATGRSTRHQITIAEKLRLRLKQEGQTLVSLEGRREAAWILLDFSVVVVHLQTQEKREYYDLEGLWFSIETLEKERDVENTPNIAATAKAATKSKAAKTKTKAKAKAATVKATKTKAATAKTTTAKAAAAKTTKTKAATVKTTKTKAATAKTTKTKAATAKATKTKATAAKTTKAKAATVKTTKAKKNKTTKDE